MLKVEFIERLSMNFKDGNPVMYEDLGVWIERNELSDYQLDILYEEIKANYKYKTFPTLAEILNIWQRTQGERNVDQTASPVAIQRKFVESWDVKKIIQMCSDIRKRGPRGSHEVDFLHQWDDLWSEYQQLKDMNLTGKEMRDKLINIKQQIIDGTYSMDQSENRKPVDIPNFINTINF